MRQLRGLFGLLFLITSVVLAMIQVKVYVSSDSMFGGRFPLLIAITIGCVGAAALLFAAGKMGNIIAGIVGLVSCLALIILIAYQLITGHGSLISNEYIIVIAYAVIFGIYGAIGLFSSSGMDGREFEDYER